MSAPLTALTLAAALGSGLVAGVFFAFSSFVMAGLARLAPADGIAAMQAINVTAVTFAFMLALFGTGAACLALAGWALAEWGEPFAGYLLAGAVLYLTGAIGLTLAYHVPRNDALARLHAGDAGAAEHWSRYVATWTTGNHARTAASLGATAAFALALHVG
jgi:uncharacterized membrane protein